MTKTITKHVKDFCSDKDGKITLAQSPNLPLAGWIAFKLAAMLTPNPQLKSGFELIGTAFLFTWAYLEITDGDSNFRRLLGTLVMLFTILSMLQA